jgi:NarL family two-component system response regulator LiaR
MEDKNIQESRSIEVAVVDGDPLARRALAGMVSEGAHFAVAAEAGDRFAALDAIGRCAPDVLLCDASTLGADDFALARELGDRFGDVPIVMLTKACEEDASVDALRLGVSAIVSKDTSPERIWDALDAVTEGQAVLEPALTMALIERLRVTPHAGRGFRPIRSELTNREWEILDLLVDGASTHEMAEQLFLTEDTVYSHVKGILRKLKVRSRAEAVEIARGLYSMPVAA